MALWFRVKQAPFVTQLTGMVGQVGAIAAAPRWRRPWPLGLDEVVRDGRAVGVVLGVLLLLLVRDSPTRRGGPADQGPGRGPTLREAWGNPGTRLGLWSHFTAQFG